MLELELPPKMHVYAPGVEGYRPVSVAVSEAPYLKVHDTVFPDSEIMRLPAIQESVPVFHGSVRILQDITLSPRLPGYEQPDVTELEIPAAFSYQACDDKVCYLPSEIPLTFKLELLPHDGERAPEEIRHKPSSSSR